MSDLEDTIDDDTRDEATVRAIRLLSPLGPVTARRLFGTFGLYVEDRLFGIVYDEIIYFRTSDATRERYEAHGSQPFVYRGTDGSGTETQYHEVPESVLDDADEACAWAYEALAVEP